ncbi:MAG: hypothetical protein EOO07_36950 [Chitinophagaceae bacterium]|nr:MAG: hypothetical protein EOO07_36950 [Chitinophagaceae bacterium]
MEASYNAQNLIYEKERTIMIVTIIGVILGIIAILVSYINIRQKNRFQKQLNLARTKQLSFINSHKVRKPLANILGICNLADKNNAKKHEMAEYLHIVYQEAREMDEKLREVEKKLNTQK